MILCRPLSVDIFQAKYSQIHLGCTGCFGDTLHRAISMQKQSIACTELHSVRQMYCLAADDEIMKSHTKRVRRGERRRDTK